jgi:hypothetical protein
VEPFPDRATLFNWHGVQLAALAGMLALGGEACRLRKSSAVAPGRLEAGTTSHCQNGFAFAVGPYRYENNQWGRQKARAASEQCLMQREQAGQKQYGWSWDWPGEAPSVYAYPEIIWGWKPWTGGVSTDARFPRRIADLQELRINYSVVTDAIGSYNLAPEVWLTHRKDTSGKPNPELITTEIMFWLDYAGISRPAGDIIEEPTIGGVRYELWKMDNMGDKGGGVGWRIYSFKSPVITRSGTLDVHLILQHMVAQGQINPADYVASVEFGNEIVGGRGTTWIERFEIEARP